MEQENTPEDSQRHFNRKKVNKRKNRKINTKAIALQHENYSPSLIPFVAHPPPLTYPPTSNTISSLFGGHLFKLK
jgi:hypothetical protein